MCNWNVYIFASTLLLLEFSDGKLPQEYKIDVYNTFNDDVRRFKMGKLKAFLPSLQELYETCYDNGNKLYQIMSDLLELYDQMDRSMKQIQRIYNCIERELAQQHDSCISKEKRLIESVKKIVTTTCYKELQDWAMITKQNCINTIKQDSCCDKIKSDYAKMRPVAGQLKSYLHREKEIKEGLSNAKTEIFHAVVSFNKNIEATLDNFVNEMLKMKLLSLATRKLKEYSDDFIIIVRRGIESEIKTWDEDLKHTEPSVKKRHDDLNHYQNECDASKQRVQSCLEATENNKAIFTQQMIHNFLNGQIFLVQNDSLVELDCEDHIPFYGAKYNENLNSASTNEDGAEVWHIVGKNENNESYKRTLVAKFVENKQVEIHETIIYSNSEITALDNKYIIKFKTVL